MKHRSKINFIIDALMFILIMAIGGIGLLMKFILIPGSKRWEIYGSNVELYLWGWDRHQWGSVHLILGYILFGLLALHIVFHWSQIKSMFHNLIHNKSLRVILTFLFVLLSMVLFLFAFVVDFEVVSPKRGEGEHRIESSRPRTEELPVSRQEKNLSKPSPRKDVHGSVVIHQERSIEVYGSMTLKEVENEYKVPADSMKKFLEIPLSTSDYENLGRLKRRYGFHMSDVERFIEKYLQMNE